MSNIKNVVKEIEASKGFEAQEEVTKVIASTRITEEEIFRVDFIAKHLGMSRSAFIGILINEGCVDAAEALGIPFIELQAQYLAGKGKKSVEEYREMLSQTGFFSEESK